MNTSNTHFSIGLDGSHQIRESLNNTLLRTPGFRQNEGASLIRGR